MSMNAPLSIIDEEEGEVYLEDGEIPGEGWDQPGDGIPLTRDIIRFGLSRIARTLDTFEFAYSRFDCRKKNICNIDALSKYVHLRIVDLGENKIKTCLPIASIQNLLLLNMESNLIESLADVPDFPFLQALCLRRNKISSSDGLFPNCLAYLQLADNYLEEVYGLTSDITPWLTVLELKGNKLKSLAGIDLPQLQRIYVAYNQLTDLKGLDGCPNLTHLHARNNNISHLEDFPAFEKLEYVNLRANDLRRYTQMILLGNAQNIRTLILKDNPIYALADYRIEALAANQNVRRLDKDPVLETDLAESRHLRNGRERGHLPGVVDDPNLILDSNSVLDLDETPADAVEDYEWLENSEN
ncbi:Leucine-rich repeat-containing protein 23 [Orchesella cincta]|uniref:Leucine-rich repeat-containing protein 23 n=1 Tax=Orchesella cincta TaxID=48709 RepID=A0A1D2N5Z1_ORCCI|nr:Leucine-rich repeat-containing protein 23 [Orchesella cincta]